MTYSTNINIDHSEIIFLLSSGIELPESLLKKLNSAYSYTSMFEENQEWVSVLKNFEIADIVDILEFDDLVDENNTKFEMWKNVRECVPNYIEFIKNHGIDKDEVRWFLVEGGDDGTQEGLQRLSMVIRGNIYKACFIEGDFIRHGWQWYINYGERYEKFYDTDVLKLKGE